MRIFLSYASEQADIAEEIELALLGASHDVFRDRSSLNAGREYDATILQQINTSDLMIFLVSPESISAGSYARTELKFARQKWSHPSHRVLPIKVAPIDLRSVPRYLRAVTIMQPVGNVAAEVVAEIAGWDTHSTEVTVHTDGKEGSALLWGYTSNCLVQSPMIECLKVCLRSHLKCDIAPFAQRLKLREALQTVETCIPSPQGYHEKLLTRAKTLAVKVPAGILPPETGFEIDSDTPFEEWPMSLSQHYHFLVEELEEYHQEFLVPISEQLEQRSPGIRLAETLGGSISTLGQLPLRLIWLDHHYVQRSWTDRLNERMNTRANQAEVGRYLNWQRKEIRKVAETLGVNVSYIKPIDQSVNSLWKTLTRRRYDQRSGLDASVLLDIITPISGQRIATREYLDRLALEIERNDQA